MFVWSKVVANDLHMMQLMPLPLHYLLLHYIDLTLLVPAYPGCPGKEAVKQLSLCLSDDSVS